VTGQAAALVAACAVVTAAIKAAGPIAFGGRPLPARLGGVVALLAPALLAALVVTQTLADGRSLAVGPEAVGVTAAGLASWRGATVAVCVLIAAALTAGLRLIS